MAIVRLEISDDNQVAGLPPLCMQCGAPATTRRPTTFYWHPQWIGYILLLALFAGLVLVPVALLLALLLHKTQRVDVPLCDRHLHPWRAQRITLLGGGLVFLLLLAASCTGFVIADPVNNLLGVVGVLLLVASALYFPVWLVTAAIIAQRSLHAGLITEREIKLMAVSRTFADALRDAEEGPRRRDRRDDRARRDDWDEPDDRVSARRNER